MIDYRTTTFNRSAGIAAPVRGQPVGGPASCLGPLPANYSRVDPVGAALSRAYAATLAEPLPPALADLLRSLE